MPKYSNQFKRPEYIDHTIVDDNNRTVGCVRVKPVGIAWRPANQRSFYSVPLDAFTAWITDPNPNTGAKRTKS